MLLLFVLIYAVNGMDDKYYCWNPSDRVNLTFNNNPAKPMDYLPKIRLIQGYYPSQFALQYLAFVYLREKMGVNVCILLSFALSSMLR